jgi:multisubunit Na+/H+ antiporter MnhC subunit
MFRAALRVAAIGSMVAVLVVAGRTPAMADGALGLNGPTGEPLPWTLAIVVGLASAAFVVRAVLKLSRRSKA